MILKRWTLVEKRLAQRDVSDAWDNVSEDFLAQNLGLVIVETLGSIEVKAG